MSFLWEMGKLFVKYQVHQTVVKSELARSASLAKPREIKPILPFTLDDIVGKDGTHCVIAAAMGAGKSNLLGHIERLMIPRLNSGSLSFYAIDPKGDLLMYLTDYKEMQLFDSQRGMVGWRPLLRKAWIPVERQATWFVDSFKSAWGDEIETARLENHIFNAVVPVLANNGTMLDVVDVLYGKRFPFLRDMWM